MTANRRSIDQVDVKGKTVLMRVDYNVPIQDGKIADDRRIRLTLDSVRSVVNRGGRLLLASHLGRPQGIGPEDHLSLAPCAERLQEMLPKQRVTLAPDCVGDAVETMVLDMQDRDVLMLENLRFHQGEKDRDPGFASRLAGLADVYCHESFGTAHRKDASVLAVPETMSRNGCPCVAGFLLLREIEQLTQAFENPARPFVAVLGGSKVSDKLSAIENVIPRVDAIVIGGAMAYTFLVGQKVAVGASKVEKDFVAAAAGLLKQAEQSDTRILLPVDHVCAQELSAKADTQVTSHAVSEGWMGLDIGPKSTQLFTGQIATAKTIYWNGPVGAFEIDPFAQGTRMLAEVIALATNQHHATSIIGGGDSASAVVQFGLDEQMTHVSTGGGASLCMLEGRRLHSVETLDEQS